MNNREYEDWDKIKEKESVNNFSDTISEQIFRH